MRPSVLSLEFEGTMGVLRNDGALVEEGSPVAKPLNPDNRTSSPEPIVVEAVVGKDGGVKNVRLISPPGSKLAGAVVDAVKRWRYRPLYENGQPVEFTTRITFDFPAPHGKP
jgi:TonB family protein